MNCPADSGSAWPWPGPSSTGRTLLLADEPTGNLDTKTSLEIMALFGEIHAAGNTVVLVTHEEDIAAYAHRVVRLRDGVVSADERKAPNPA